MSTVRVTVEGRTEGVTTEDLSTEGEKTVGGSGRVGVEVELKEARADLKMEMILSSSRTRLTFSSVSLGRRMGFASQTSRTFLKTLFSSCLFPVLPYLFGNFGVST